MSKKMTPLQAFRIMVKDNDLELPYHNTIQAVETALKDYEKITSGDFHIEPINVHIENQKQIKALEIIKEKEVNILWLYCSFELNCSSKEQCENYNRQWIYLPCKEEHYLTKVEFDLLKEVLL